MTLDELLPIVLAILGPSGLGLGAWLRERWKRLREGDTAQKIERALVEAIEETESAAAKRRANKKATQFGVEIKLAEDVVRLTKRYQKREDL